MNRTNDTALRIGQLLMQQGAISQEKLDYALEEQRITGELLGDLLIRKGYIAPLQLEEILKTPGVRTFNLNNYIINLEVIKLIPRHMAFRYNILPIAKKNQVLTIAMEKPNDIMVIEELSRITGFTIDPIAAHASDIKKVLHICYSEGEAIQKLANSIDKKSLTKEAELGKGVGIVKLADFIMSEAIELDASDIHIEPEETAIGIRYRIDGMLHHRTFLPKYLQSALTARFKVMANLDIAEKRVAQDGRIGIHINDRDIDLRMSTCPTVHGENTVLRILDKEGGILTLNGLGVPSRELALVDEALQSTFGIILVTGPTGSGKTTTLYAALQKINREDINIMTVEDPVEYDFPRIRQVHVNQKTATFANTLRTFLRQDPDVIMVGEIRDLETGEIAIQAALTGHLVLSTLHTNDAPSTFIRLADMGLKPFLIADGIKAIIAQRLLRKVCFQCKEEKRFTPEMMQLLSLDGTPKKNYLQGRGCKFCTHTGYKGRTGTYEVLKVTPEIQKVVAERGAVEEIKKTAIKQGMRTLRDVGVAKMLAGITTPDEVLRLT